MKTLLAISLWFVASAAWACPGGHIKTLTIEGGTREIAEIDMIQGRIQLVDKEVELLSVGYIPGNGDVFVAVCGYPNTKVEVCDWNQGLGIQPVQNPTMKMQVKVLVDWAKTMVFDVTDFYVARGGCGSAVEGRLED